MCKEVKIRKSFVIREEGNASFIIRLVNKIVKMQIGPGPNFVPLKMYKM